jgi:hypothetical protein
MQKSSAILEEVFVVQARISVGSNGTATGDHKTRTMPINPRILRRKQDCCVNKNTEQKNTKFYRCIYLQRKIKVNRKLTRT